MSFVNASAGVTKGSEWIKLYNNKELIKQDTLRSNNWIHYLTVRDWGKKKFT